ncbi:hypothetical protein BDV93DRAFT_339636 [Ceratobasidium sp. AG-I]|nr:hypothetical protein BDV93DRAFT_339636 [Ceratobasidium sp. AG-I]
METSQSQKYQLTLLWRKFRKFSLVLSKLPEASDEFQYHFPTWVTLLRHSQMRFGPVLADDSIRGHFRQTGQIWLDFGMALGYAEPFVGSRALKCAHPRCAIHDLDVGARLACGGCSKAFYCSLYCQNGHWRLKTPESHRSVCPRLPSAPYLPVVPQKGSFHA